MKTLYKEVYKRTSDDWCPSYVCGDVTLVSVVLLEYYPEEDDPDFEAGYAINISGDDDLEIVIDYKPNELEIAYSDFLDLVMLDELNMKDAHKLQALRVGEDK